MNIVLFDADLDRFLAKTASLSDAELSKLNLRRFNKMEDISYCSPQRNNAHVKGSPQTSGVNTPNRNEAPRVKLEYESDEALAETKPAKNCSNCSVCKLEINLNAISNLVCKIVKSGVNKLTVYLKVAEERHLYSTLLLNYIKALYSLIVINSKHHLENLDIINNAIIDVIILPIFSCAPLQRAGVKISPLGQPPDDKPVVDLESDPDSEVLDNVYLYTDTKFLYNDFYFSAADGTPNHGGEPSAGNPDMPLDCTGGAPSSSPSPTLWLKTYDNVMFCGTFDYLHFGHKLLLLAAFLSCRRKLCLGVAASDQLLQRKTNAHKIQGLELRKLYLSYYVGLMSWVYACPSGSQSPNSVSTTPSFGDEAADPAPGRSAIRNYISIDFNLLDLDLQGSAGPESGAPTDFRKYPHVGPEPEQLAPPRLSVEIFNLYDIIGPARELKEKFALLITPEIIGNSFKVNEIRAELNLVPWDPIVVGLVCYYADGKLAKLSSSEVRDVL